jgi:hypothetical protein
MVAVTVGGIVEGCMSSAFDFDESDFKDASELVGQSFETPSGQHGSILAQPGKRTYLVQFESQPPVRRLLRISQMNGWRLCFSSTEEQARS